MLQYESKYDALATKSKGVYTFTNEPVGGEVKAPEDEPLTVKRLSSQQEWEVQEKIPAGDLPESFVTKKRLQDRKYFRIIAATLALVVVAILAGIIGILVRNALEGSSGEADKFDDLDYVDKSEVVQ